MILKLTALGALSLTSLLAQTGTAPAAALAPAAQAAASDPTVPLLQPDMNDSMVVRAQQDLERTKQLIGQGALPLVRLRKAEEAVEDAKDMSILRLSLFSKDLLPEQADQMVVIAQRMAYRRQKSLAEMQRLVDSGIVSRAEGEATAADFERAKNEVQLALSRAQLMEQMAQSLRLEKAIASLETDVESHPEWNGRFYTRYDGRGVFTHSDFLRINSAFMAKFAKPLPVSADGETATHRSLGFDHRGRVDVALNPGQPEGVWLLHMLETNKIPYFAFRMAIPHKATGAHIHIGPQSTRLALAAHTASGL